VKGWGSTHFSAREKKPTGNKGNCVHYRGSEDSKMAQTSLWVRFELFQAALPTLGDFFCNFRDSMQILVDFLKINMRFSQKGIGGNHLFGRKCRGVPFSDLWPTMVPRPEKRKEENCFYKAN
jgi:hypothetical protein